MEILLTPAEVKRELQARGTTIAEWARSHGYPERDVYAVLSGRTRGLRGKAHEVAAALGLKPKPEKSERYAGLDIPENRQDLNQTDKEVNV